MAISCACCDLLIRPSQPNLGAILDLEIYQIFPTYYENDCSIVTQKTHSTGNMGMLCFFLPFCLKESNFDLVVSKFCPSGFITLLKNESFVRCPSTATLWVLWAFRSKESGLISRNCALFQGYAFEIIFLFPNLYHKCLCC